jgi:hypothetical protein
MPYLRQALAFDHFRIEITFSRMRCNPHNFDWSMVVDFSVGSVYTLTSWFSAAAREG